MDEIIVRIRNKVSNLPDAKNIPPPLTPEQVEAAEKQPGFALPKLLRQLYIHIGNGWFGSSFGIYPLLSNRTNYGVSKKVWEEKADWNYDSILSCYQAYKAAPDNWEAWRDGLIPLCYYGCTVNSVVDCFTKEGIVWRMDASEIKPEPEAESLRKWLKKTYKYFKVSNLVFFAQTLGINY